ncbi:hypothetical protein [Demequina lutea]|uniref:Uncharacterized protein n=1 Tax=Demequina lutea TaxID=431489 RepID=A0A7Y9ZC52_9MICO|nr:hypothetical protein [Demequina lutea]NYI42669.1 hypothetical protein [Demequina lutea]
MFASSALYVLAATELHGIEVRDAERARPLVFGMLLGEKSQSKVAKIVMQAVQTAAAGASGFGEAAWDKTSGARSIIRCAAAGGVGAIKGDAS